MYLWEQLWNCPCPSCSAWTSCEWTVYWQFDECPAQAEEIVCVYFFFSLVCLCCCVFSPALHNIHLTAYGTTWPICAESAVKRQPTNQTTSISVISFCSEIKDGSTFWYWLTQVVLEYWTLETCLGGSVGWDTVRTDHDGLSEKPGFNPGSTGRFLVWISGAHALRLISWARRCPL